MTLASIPQPLFRHLSSLKLQRPAAHPASFFDPPSGPVVDEAKTFIHSILPEWLQNHSYRTYASGLAIADAVGWSKPGAEADRMGWNKDVWFLTAIFHDVGLQSEGLQSRLSFEIWGGVKARELLLKWGASQDDADEVCESIIRHTEAASNGSVRLMGALIQMSTSHDFRGYAVPSWIHPKDSQTITERWPRLGLDTHFWDSMGKEIAHKPGCIGTQWAA